VDPCDEHWSNNHLTNNHEKWSAVTVQLPVIAPVEEEVTVKNAIFNALAE
jgi:hypothetical protein